VNVRGLQRLFQKEHRSPLAPAAHHAEESLYSYFSHLIRGLPVYTGSMLPTLGCPVSSLLPPAALRARATRVVPAPWWESRSPRRRTGRSIQNFGCLRTYGGKGGVARRVRTPASSAMAASKRLRGSCDTSQDRGRARPRPSDSVANPWQYSASVFYESERGARLSQLRAPCDAFRRGAFYSAERRRRFVEAGVPEAEYAERRRSKGRDPR